MAKLTLADLTPSIRFNPFSILAAHAAQDMPDIFMISSLTISILLSSAYCLPPGFLCFAGSSCSSPEHRRYMLYDFPLPFNPATAE
jgi:hypothetical protein